MWNDPEIRSAFLEQYESLLKQMSECLNGDDPGLSATETRNLHLLFHRLNGDSRVAGLDKIATVASACEQLLEPFSKVGQRSPGRVAAALGRIKMNLEKSVSVLHQNRISDPKAWSWVDDATQLCAGALLAKDDTSVASGQRSRQSSRVNRKLAKEQTARFESESEMPVLKLAQPDQARTVDLHKSPPRPTKIRKHYRCALRVKPNCPIPDATLALIRTRLSEIGTIEKFESLSEFDNGIRVGASLAIDGDVGVLARALVMSHVDSVQLFRQERKIPAKLPAAIARRTLMADILKEMSRMFDIANRLINGLERGRWKPDELAPVEIGLLELGNAAGALEYPSIAALSLELACTLGAIAVDPAGLTDALETTKTGLARIQEVGSPGLGDPFDYQLASTLRLARGEAPVTKIDGAWIAELPDNSSVLEPIEIQLPWTQLQTGAVFLDLVRNVASQMRFGRGRLRGSTTGAMTRREFGATFWASSRSKPLEFLTRETTTTVPVSLLKQETPPESDRPKPTPTSIEMAQLNRRPTEVALDSAQLNKSLEESAVVSAQPPNWGELVSVPIAQIEQMCLWLSDIQLHCDSADPKLRDITDILCKLRKRSGNLLTEKWQVTLRQLRREFKDSSVEVQFSASGQFDHRLANVIKEISDQFLRLLFECASDNLNPGPSKLDFDGYGNDFILRLKLSKKIATGIDVAAFRRKFGGLCCSIDMVTEGSWHVLRAIINLEDAIPVRVLVAEVNGRAVAFLPSAVHVVQLDSPNWTTRQLSDFKTGLKLEPAFKAKRAIMAPVDQTRRPIAWAVDHVLGYQDAVYILDKERKSPQVRFGDGSSLPVLDLTRTDWERRAEDE